MAIRSGIFLVAGLTALSLPKKVFRVQTRVITYLAETIHLKFLSSMLRVEQARALTALRNTGVAFLIISAMLFVWALYEWGL